MGALYKSSKEAVTQDVAQNRPAGHGQAQRHGGTKQIYLQTLAISFF